MRKNASAACSIQKPVQSIHLCYQNELSQIHTQTHTVYVYRLSLCRRCCCCFLFFSLNYHKTVCLNVARKTALPVKVNEHNSGHFNNRKIYNQIVRKTAKTAFNHLKVPANLMYNKILSKNSSCVIFCCCFFLFPLSYRSVCSLLLICHFLLVFKI